MLNAEPQYRCFAWCLECPDCSALVAVFLVYNRIESFLIRDERFALSGPTAPNGSYPGYSGSLACSTRAVQAVFSEDLGRSVT